MRPKLPVSAAAQVRIQPLEEKCYIHLEVCADSEQTASQDNGLSIYMDQSIDRLMKITCLRSFEGVCMIGICQFPERFTVGSKKVQACLCLQRPG